MPSPGSKPTLSSLTITMTERQSVSVFWDAAAKPDPGRSGFQVVKTIQNLAESLGLLRSFNFYTDIEDYDIPPAFRSQAQCSGVTLVDTAASGRTGSASKMILVDAFICALDNIPSKHTILIISVDPDVCYGVSLMRRRGYRIFILCPLNSHPSLLQFRCEGEFDKSVFQDQANGQRSDFLPRPQASGSKDGRRASFRLSSSNLPVTGGQDSSKPADAFPPTTLQVFREEFVASPTLPTPPDAKIDTHTLLSRGKSSSRSTSQSSSKSGGQVYRTPRAHMETDDEDDFITITPPRVHGTVNMNSQLDDASGTRPTPPSSKSSPSGFFIVSEALPTVPVAKISPLNSQDMPAMAPGVAAGQGSPTLRPAEEEGVSSVLTPTKPRQALVSQTPPLPPVPAGSLPMSQETPIPGGDKVTSNSTEKPPPQALLTPSFFPPPPLSPDRTNIIPLARFPISPSSASSISSLGNATKGSPSTSAFELPTGVARSAPLAATSTPAAPLPASGLKVEGLTLLKGGKELAPTASLVVPPTAAFNADSKSAAKLAPHVGPTSEATARPAALTVPRKFEVLVTVMKELRKQTARPTTRSTLGAILPKRQPDVYDLAGYGASAKPFSKYLGAAEIAGIVRLEEPGGIIVLEPEYY